MIMIARAADETARGRMSTWKTKTVKTMATKNAKRTMEHYFNCGAWMVGTVS